MSAQMTHRSGPPKRSLIEPLRLQGPPKPAQMDIIIGLHQGSTVALEATPEQLRMSKRQPILSLSERIEQLSRDNGHLRHEIACYKTKQTAAGRLKDDMQKVSEKLERALQRFDKAWKQVDDDRTEMLKI